MNVHVSIDTATKGTVAKDDGLMVYEFAAYTYRIMLEL